jgi:hypothetical protein
MVAANYAQRRSELAKGLGLGQSRKQAAASSAATDETVSASPEADAKPKRRTAAKKAKASK